MIISRRNFLGDAAALGLLSAFLAPDELRASGRAAADFAIGRRRRSAAAPQFV